VRETSSSHQGHSRRQPVTEWKCSGLRRTRAGEKPWMFSQPVFTDANASQRSSFVLDCALFLEPADEGFVAARSTRLSTPHDPRRRRRVLPLGTWILTPKDVPLDCATLHESLACKLE
jgi:hypothetical protein